MDYKEEHALIVVTFNQKSILITDFNSLLELKFVLYRTYLNTNMIVPFARCTQAFLLIDTSLCILVSIEFIMKVSGTQSLFVASPLRIMV